MTISDEDRYPPAVELREEAARLPCNLEMLKPLLTALAKTLADHSRAGMRADPKVQNVILDTVCALQEATDKAILQGHDSCELVRISETARHLVNEHLGRMVIGSVDGAALPANRAKRARR